MSMDLHIYLQVWSVDNGNQWPQIVHSFCWSMTVPKTFCISQLCPPLSHMKALATRSVVLIFTSEKKKSLCEEGQSQVIDYFYYKYGGLCRKLGKSLHPTNAPVECLQPHRQHILMPPPHELWVSLWVLLSLHVYFCFPLPANDLRHIHELYNIHCFFTICLISKLTVVLV